MLSVCRMLEKASVNLGKNRFVFYSRFYDYSLVFLPIKSCKAFSVLQPQDEGVMKTKEADQWCCLLPPKNARHNSLKCVAQHNAYCERVSRLKLKRRGRWTASRTHARPQARRLASLHL